MNEKLKMLICSHFGLTWEEVTARNQKQEFVNARKGYTYIAYRELDLTYEEIANCLGYTNHTTPRHLNLKCQEHIDCNEPIKLIIENIKKEMEDHIIKIKCRQVGRTHEMVLQIKKTLEERGECGVGMMIDPTDTIARLKDLGINAKAEPTYRNMPPIIKKDDNGNPIDVLGEKCQVGCVFYLR